MVGVNRKSGNVACRLLVIGSNRVRLNRVFSSLVLSQQDQDRNDAKCSGDNLQIEHLPCIAKFASYMDESKTNVRYLESVEYYPHDSTGTLSLVSSSLLPFFDQDKEKNDASRFPPIAGVAIGSGIEGSDDTALIEKWVNTMLSGHDDPVLPRIKTIEPNASYRSMSDELAAYKQLSPEEKDEANRQHSMGPEKMVKFVVDFTIELIQEAYKQEQPQPDVHLDATQLELVADAPHIIDPYQNRYFCRMCRTALFGESDLQDPPHEVSQHQFSRRKMNHSAMTVDPIPDRCQSYFLQQSLRWMGDNIQNGISEGKLNCPNCAAKIGTWIWSGTQCSCGTWVVPAIQVPKSKVDVVKPSIADLPISTVDAIHEKMIE